ncbi:hypothetical protein ABBQ32_006316 [Trebouxia sp. C0010 RCD-2024]
MVVGDFRLLQASPAIQKEVPSGADDLLEHYGLSGIYKLFTARGHDTYLKGLPADLDFRSGKESLELSALAMLNPLGSELSPFTPTQLMPFKLQAKSAPITLSQEDLGQLVSLDALRVKANPPAAMPPVGARPKERKDKKAKKEKKTKGSKRKASEEPSDGTTTMTGMPSTGTSTEAVRLRIKQPRLG